MRKLLWAALVALPFLLIPARAHAWGCDGCGGSCGPWTVNLGFTFGITNGCGGNGGLAQAGPWFSYWPYEAYFQTPAPYPSYPYWIGSSSAAVAPAPVVPLAPVSPPGQLPPPLPGPAR